MTWYKATRPDGTDYHTGTIHYEPGKRVRPAKSSKRVLCGPGVLHASTSPEKAVSYNARWPWRLFEVEGRPFLTDDYDPHKAGFKQLCVVKEVPPYLAFGPNGKLAMRVISKVVELDAQQIRDLAASRAALWAALRDVSRPALWAALRDALRPVSWDALWDASRAALRDVSWDASRAAVWDVLRAVVTADLVGQYGLTKQHIRILYRPWQQVVGDPDIEELLA